jgi:hypothetical protein
MSEFGEWAAAMSEFGDEVLDEEARAIVGDVAAALAESVGVGLAKARSIGAREHADKLRTAIAENEMLQRQLGEAEGRIRELTAQSESWRIAHQAWQRWGDSLRPASVLNGDEPTREWIADRLRALDKFLEQDRRDESLEVFPVKLP